MTEGRTARRRMRLSDEVADYVREKIISGQLGAGEYVRPEKIAEELQLSTTPAREGLLTLQTQGLLRVEPRRGFVVVGLSPDDVEDVFVAQALLAGELAARAATRLTERAVGELAALQSRIETAARHGDLTTVRELNDRFHKEIYRAAGSPRIHWLLASTLGYAPRLLWTTIEGWPDLTVHDHRDILDALARRSPDAARRAMERHLRNAGTVLANRLRPAPGHSR